MGDQLGVHEAGLRVVPLREGANGENARQQGARPGSSRATRLQALAGMLEQTIGRSG